MPAHLQRITPFLWFDAVAEEAAELYTSIFPNSGIDAVTRFNASSAAASGKPEGSVLTVSFHLDNQHFNAINGGPQFRFTEAVSFVVSCADQRDVDHYWEHLAAGGDPAAQQCGWLKDRFGLSWQIVPDALFDTVHGPDPDGALRATQAMMQMQKIDIAALQRAYYG